MLLSKLGRLYELPNQKIGNVYFVLLHGGFRNDTTPHKLVTPLVWVLAFPLLKRIDRFQMSR